ncbi:MAG: hypothetical protein ACOYNL_05105 [Rickettsiales bacterium]
MCILYPLPTIFEPVDGSAHINNAQANAIKHAYAAAQIYLLARQVMPDDDAADFVWWLGTVNEHIEQGVCYFGK